MADCVARLTAELQSLPSDVNPYAWLKNFLWRNLAAHIDPWSRNLSYFNIACFCLCFLVCLWVMYAQWRQGSLWLLRFQHTPSGRIILPNTSVCWTVCSAVYCPLAIWDRLWNYHISVNNHVPPTLSVASWCFVWPPLLTAVWTHGWGVFVAVWLTRPKTRILKLFTLKAWHINAFFIFFFIVANLISVPFFLHASFRVQDSWNVYQKMARALQPAIESWTVGQPMEVQAGWMDLFREFDASGPPYYRSIRRAIIVHLLAHGFGAVVFVPAIVSYIRMVRWQLTEQRRDQSFSLSNQTVANDLRMYTLRSSYSIMMMEAWSVLLTVCIYLGVCIWTAIQSKAIIVDRIPANVLNVLPFLVFSLFGVPANVAVAWRVLRQDKTRRMDAAQEPFGPLSLVQGIKVETQMAINIDRGDGELDKPKRVLVALSGDGKYAIGQTDQDAQEKDKWSESMVMVA